MGISHTPWSDGGVIPGHVGDNSGWLQHNFDRRAFLFEAVSALGTVGLSTGITAELTGGGKAVLMLLMFMGRVGIVSFGIALTMEDEAPETRGDDELSL